MKTQPKLSVAVICVALQLLPAGALFAQADVKQHPACGYCGMNREQYAHSRMLVTYDDQTEAGLCSLRCAAVELMVKLDKTPTLIQVGDYGTKQLLDAEKAVWVIGGSKPGVMTQRAKWAFQTSREAEQYVKANGGRLASHEEAMKAAFEDVYEDTKKIRERRKHKKLSAAKAN